MEIGPLATECGRREVSELVEDARSKGATVVAGTSVEASDGGWYYAPTVVTGLTPEMRLWTEEAFGSVALFRSAWVASNCDPDSAAYYQCKRAEGKKHNAAVICLARRRCDVIHAMLRNGTLYTPRIPRNLPAAA